MKLFKITIPASTANIGPGFDSMGMALKRYLTLHVYQSDQWEFEHHSPCLPEEVIFEEHFIYQVALNVARQFGVTLPSCKVMIESDIPLARGLGSSASAVVAGIELANQLCNLSLDVENKLALATQIEGHPDNVAPSLLGGLIITATDSGGKVNYLKSEELTLDIVLFIPNTELKTDDARKVLPAVFSSEYASSASGISNLMIAALLTKDYSLAGKMMEKDQFHEPFRAKLIPNYTMIKHEAKQLGAYGTVISGAGPTMISFVPHTKGLEFAEQMKIHLPSYEVTALQIDYSGIQVEKDVPIV